MHSLIRKPASRILRAVVVLAIGFVIGANPSRAQNLVQNFSFETGTTTGWTFSAAVSGSDFYIGSSVPNGVSPHSGLYMAAFGAVGVLNDALTQSISTSSGQQYDFNFWLNNADGRNASYFTVSWGSRVVLQIDNNSANFGWTDFDFIEAATGPTTITFAGLNVPAWIALDDVSVKAVPEPSTYAIILGIFSLGFVVVRRRFG